MKRLVVQESWVVQAQEARAKKIRKLGFLGLALLVLSAAACRPPKGWTNEYRRAAFVTCMDNIGEKDTCVCIVRALEREIPDPEDAQLSQARRAVRSCLPVIPEKA